MNSDVNMSVKRSRNKGSDENEFDFDTKHENSFAKQYKLSPERKPRNKLVRTTVLSSQTTSIRNNNQNSQPQPHRNMIIDVDKLDSEKDVTTKQVKMGARNRNPSIVKRPESNKHRSIRFCIPDQSNSLQSGNVSSQLIHILSSKRNSGQNRMTVKSTSASSSREAGASQAIIDELQYLADGVLDSFTSSSSNYSSSYQSLSTIQRNSLLSLLTMCVNTKTIQALYQQHLIAHVFTVFRAVIHHVSILFTSENHEQSEDLAICLMLMYILIRDSNLLPFLQTTDLNFIISATKYIHSHNRNRLHSNILTKQIPTILHRELIELKASKPLHSSDERLETCDENGKEHLIVEVSESVVNWYESLIENGEYNELILVLNYGVLCRLLVLSGSSRRAFSHSKLISKVSLDSILKRIQKFNLVNDTSLSQVNVLFIILEHALLETEIQKSIVYENGTQFCEIMTKFITELVFETSESKKKCVHDREVVLVLGLKVLLNLLHCNENSAECLYAVNGLEMCMNVMRAFDKHVFDSSGFDILVLCISLMVSIVEQVGERSTIQFESSNDVQLVWKLKEMMETVKERERNDIQIGDHMERSICIGYLVLFIGVLMRYSFKINESMKKMMLSNDILKMAEILEEFFAFQDELGINAPQIKAMYEETIAHFREISGNE